MERIRKLRLLATRVVNPLPTLADRFGIRTSPYRLKLRSGIAIEIRPRVGDLFGFYEILLREDYFSSGQTLAPGDTVVDVGANIGCFALAASKRVGARGRVFAVEPDLATYRQLVRNIELNGVANITPLQVAIADIEGTALLRTADNRLFSSFHSSVNGQEIAGKEQEVKVTTLGGLFATHRIERCHYLKLDCECAEHQIVASLTSAMASRIDQITMEIHRVPGHEFRNLDERLRRLGFGRAGEETLAFYRRRGGEENSAAL